MWCIIHVYGRWYTLIKGNNGKKTPFFLPKTLSGWVQEAFPHVERFFCSQKSCFRAAVSRPEATATGKNIPSANGTLFCWEHFWRPRLYSPGVFAASHSQGLEHAWSSTQMCLVAMIQGAALGTLWKHSLWNGKSRPKSQSLVTPVVEPCVKKKWC